MEKFDIYENTEKLNFYANLHFAGDSTWQHVGEVIGEVVRVVVAEKKVG